MAPPQPPSDPWGRLAAFVGATLGLHYPPGRHADLARGFRGAAQEWGFEDGQACIDWLLAQAPTPAMVQVLANHLTVGETYFYRDQPVLDALAGDILPALIHARRGQRKQLRLWCAACCTGEEAYTLAILLHRLLPDLQAWDVTVLATDVNTRFLDKAAAGRYGEWSFRDAPGWLRPRYFERGADGSYTVLPEIRRMVQFGHLNLVDGADRFAHADVHTMDLVLCRNVLMYFRAPQIARAMGKLWHCLADGGWLVLAPSEVPGARGLRFRTVVHPGAILLCRNGEPADALAPDAEPAVPPSALPSSLLDVSVLAAVAGEPGGDTAALAQQARDCANQGRLAQALDWCDRWLGVDRLDPGAHYVRAIVLLEQGDAEAAQAELQRTIYLDGSFVMAHFTLGHLARRLGDTAQARRHHENTRRLLARHRPGDVLPESGELTAGQLAQVLHSLASFEVAL